jgi:hypothetical protein
MASKLGEKNFGANFNVVNTDTGIWARPYVVLEDGRVYYGEVRYLNLVQEATDKLNLAPTGKGVVNANYSVKEFAVTKDFAKENSTAAQIKDKTFRQQIKAGYSPEKGMFYVYGSYSIDADSNVKANAIQRFGVIVDKKGTIAEGDADVAKKLLVDKGFIQGLAQKDNDKMDEDEFGAVIAPKDAVTGVWLRTFVDFGNGLVVYSKLNLKDDQDRDIPYNTALGEVSNNSVSALLRDAANFKVTSSAHKVKDNHNDRMLMTVSKTNINADKTWAIHTDKRTTKAGKDQIFEDIKVSIGNTDEDKANWITEMGLVIDKTGSYNPETSNKQLVVGEGFIEVSKDGLLTKDTVTDINWVADNAQYENTTIDFNAITTPENAAAKVNFRGYVVYKGIKIYTAVNSKSLSDIANFSEFPGYANN